MEPLPPVNHVFIDFENVHQFDLAIIGTKSVNLTLLVGAKQTKLDAELVEKLLLHAGAVQLVRLSSSGRNALDFALAYYVGRAAVADPGGCFHIISRDTGFDALVEHLRSQNIRVNRHEDVSTLFVIGMPPPKPVAATKLPAPAKQKARVSPKPAPKALPGVSRKELCMATVLDLLNKVPANRPKKYSRLVSHLEAHFGKAASEPGVRTLIEKLRSVGYLSVEDNGSITYGTDLK